MYIYESRQKFRTGQSVPFSKYKSTFLEEKGPFLEEKGTFLEQIYEKGTFILKKVHIFNLFLLQKGTLKRPLFTSKRVLFCFNFLRFGEKSTFFIF